jgi:hypothetical protein
MIWQLPCVGSPLWAGGQSLFFSAWPESIWLAAWISSARQQRVEPFLHGQPAEAKRLGKVPVSKGKKENVA